MKIKIILLFVITILVLISLNKCSQPIYEGHTIRDLKNGRWTEDSTYVYELPFQKGKKVYLIQAYDSKFSHKNELSLDFKIKIGTPIHAAREGIVIDIKEDSKEGGLKDEHLSQGNHVLIQHDDNTYAGYWHLEYNGALVEIGDTIEKGQLIGRSGNTGYSAFPHLHFWVYKMEDGNKITIPTRFNTTVGIKYLRPARFYKRPK